MPGRRETRYQEWRRQRLLIKKRPWLQRAGIAGVETVTQWFSHAGPVLRNHLNREHILDIPFSPTHPVLHEWSSSGLHAAWLGHSTVLVQIDGFTILTDPVFSERIGLRVGRMTVGLQRLVAPAATPEQLPHIDLILISHAHMDHMDLPSLHRLAKPWTTVVTAKRTAELMRRRRYQNFGVVCELGWGEQVQIGPVVVRGLEVNHWGARYRTDTRRGYNGYLIESGRHRVLFAGDTADTDKFRGVAGIRHKPIDLAIFPVGAYNPWEHVHCTPEQAWRMAAEARSEFVLPVHHSTFRLGREPMGEPLLRLSEAAGARADSIALRDIGQEFRLI